jgi:hypothetical protein
MIKQKLLLASAGLWICLSVAAQSETPPPSMQTAQSLLGQNLIKFNVTGVLIQNYMLQYERVINKKQSIAFTFDLAPNVPLPFKSTLLKDFGSNSDASRAIAETVYKKYIATLEYRFYFNGNAPKGLYFAPFLRYMNMSQSNVYTFTPSDGQLHTADMHSNFNGFGVGFLIGDQFTLGPHFALDWWIIGPFYGTNINANFVGTDPKMGDMSAQDLANVENNIQNIKLPLYKVTAVATPATNTLEAKVSGPYYGVRAFGLAFAYRF